MIPPLKPYQDLVDEGTLDPDPAQEEAARSLERLARSLRQYKPGEKAGRFGFGKPAKRPQGVYLWGGVGVGKSLLMDLFMERAPIKARRRVHFHAFMQEVHQFIAEWRAADEATRKAHPHRARSASLDDPIPHAAKMIFAKAHLFCFDELQVTDITDAMLLGRLFEQLFERGVVIVATSNRPPEDLYKDGINRELFLPFIDLMKKEMDVIELIGAKDYRLDRLTGADVYFSPLGAEANEAMNEAWRQMTANACAERAEIDVGRRQLVVPCSARGVGRGTFDHWCGQALGPKDYLVLAAEYPVLFIDNIPKLGPHNRNEAKRFVTLIDALYEARCKLICSADAKPDELYTEGDGVFEFGRTVSRLHEMQSQEYLHLPHIGTEPATAE